MSSHVTGGRYDFEDGGTFCGGWEDGKAHGHGVCTGPKGQGEYCGQWAYGFEASGIYTWPSGNCYQGQWMQGKRHGLGIEKKDKWIYKGEWTQGFKGRYGTRLSVTSGAKYEGTWTTGLQDGYGCETYADGGTYQGQWLRGTRHGYGVRQSVPYGLAAHYRAQTLRSSLTSLRSEEEDEQVVKTRDKRIDETRGGFVLTAKSEPDHHPFSLLDKPRSIKRTIVATLKLKKQRSTGDISEGAGRQHKFTSSMRSTRSFASQNSTLSVESGISSASKATEEGDDQSFYSQDDITDVNVTECYMGEWKNDKRSGFGVSERSDGLRYEGEWYNNKKYGYGQTTFKDSTKEEGKYKNNMLVSAGHKSKLMVLQKSKVRERIDSAVTAAQKAAQLAMQKADIAVSRMANARAKAEQALHAAETAQQDSDLARLVAKEIDPNFHQPGTQILKRHLEDASNEPDLGVMRNLQYKPQIRSNSVIDRTSRGTSQPVPAQHAQTHLQPPREDGRYGAPDFEPHTKPPQMNGLGSTFNSSTKPEITKANSSSERPAVPGPPKPRRLEIKTSLDQLINSDVLYDHFDHYGAPSMENRLTPNTPIKGEAATPKGQQSYTDSQSISKPVTSSSKPVATTSKVKTKQAKDDSDLYMMENDIRKHVMAEADPIRTQDDTALPSHYRQEKQAQLNQALNKQMGSLPDLAAIKEFASMPREELMKLSAARREEIKKLLEEQERRNAGDVGVLASDVRNWLQQRQLMMFVVALNATLASVIFNMFGG